MIGKTRLEPFHRQTVDLLDLCISITDCHHSTPVYLDKGKLVIRNFNIKGGRLLLDNLSYTDKEHFDQRISRAVPEAGDLIITREAPMGEVCMIPEGVECCLGQRMVLIKPDKTKVSSEFLLFALQSEFVQKQIIQSDKTGSIVSNLRIPVLKALQIPRLGIQSETSIGYTLSNIVQKIELNNKINDELESMAKLIYDYWFVQFDFPDENGNPYKSSGGKMVYSEELKREIPDGWKTYKAAEVFIIDLGGTPSTKNKNYWEGNFNWLNSGEIAQFPILKSELTVSEEGIKNSATTLLPKGTCVLSITRHLRASILGIESCVNQSVVGIYETNEIKSSFIYPYLKNELPRLMSLRTGAQQPHINKGIVDESPIVIPPFDVLRSYNSLVNSLYDEIINKAKENIKLAELRDWLLPMLMNGQVTIKN